MKLPWWLRGPEWWVVLLMFISGVSVKRAGTALAIKRQAEGRG